MFVGAYSPPKAIAQGGVDRALVAGAGIVGLPPAAHTLAVGPLPGSARSVADSRLPLCPPRASGQEFLFEIFAMPAARSVKGLIGTEPPSRILREVSEHARAIGGFTARYG